MNAYIAGWNTPGYLPETEPAIFDNETDAIRYLTDTIDRFWDEDYLANGIKADKQWADISSSLPYETAPFNVQNWDGSLTFWVSIHPQPTTNPHTHTEGK